MKKSDVYKGFVKLLPFTSKKIMDWYPAKEENTIYVMLANKTKHKVLKVCCLNKEPLEFHIKASSYEEWLASF